jgi:hypothetical protein
MLPFRGEHEMKLVDLGRSPGLPDLSAFPFAANSGLALTNLNQNGLTVAGPLPIFTGFPCHPVKDRIQYRFGREGEANAGRYSVVRIQKSERDGKTRSCPNSTNLRVSCLSF